MRKRTILSIGAIVIIAASAFHLLSEPGRDSPARQRLESPDGRFEAAIRSSFWSSLGFFLFGTVMPGQSGDRPGRVTVYEVATGKSCGTASVVMVGSVTLDWNMDDNLAGLGRPRSAVWDLSGCKVRFDDLYPD